MRDGGATMGERDAAMPHWRAPLPTTPTHTPRPVPLVAALLLAMGVVASVAPLSPAPAAAQTLPLAGNQMTLPAGARVLGPLPPGRQLRLVVGLAARHADLLDAFLRLRGRRATPQTRSTLTPAQF